MPPLDPAHEEHRLAELARYEILDSAPERVFDRVVRLAARLLDVPISLVSLVDRDRQWFKAVVGLDTAQTSRDVAFCNYTIEASEPLVVEDALLDVRFQENPLVRHEPGIRFYAGVPLTVSSGFRLGTLCAIDTKPRRLSADHLAILEDLAATVVEGLELRRALSERKRAEGWLRDIADCAGDWFWSIDASGCFESVTDEFVRATGVDAAWLVGRPWRALVAVDEDSNDAMAEIARAIVAQRPFRDVILPCRLGEAATETTWLRLSGRAQIDDAGAVRGYRGAATDITRYRRQAAKLAAAERRNHLLAAAIEATPIGIAVRGSDAEEFDYVNPAFAATFGLPVNDLIARGGPGSAIAAQLLGTRPEGGDFEIRRPDGESFLGAVRVATVRDPDAAKLGDLVLLQDVTIERRREQDERERHKLTSLGELAGGVAHEINNLLQPALTFLPLWRRKLDADDIEDVDLVVESVRKARDIVRQILTFARRDERANTELDLVVEARSTLDLLRGILPASLRVVDALPPGPIPILGDRTGLTQVLTNLVVNASQATAGRGTVRISASKRSARRGSASGFASLMVSDDGCGMDAVTRSKIFEPFFTTKPIGEGTGLGLAVTYGIVRRWGGTIEVDSKPNKGSTFRILIPQLTYEGEQHGRHPRH